MSTTATSFASGVSPAQRLDGLFEELSQLCGQRNAIDGRLVEIVAEIERDELCGMTGARSIAALVAWKTGVTPHNADTLVAVARRLSEFPLCVEGLREGRLSLDQVGVIAERAADGSDEHYAQLAASATVTQLRTAIKLEPQPDPEPDPETSAESPPEARPEPTPEITKTVDEEYTTWRIRLPRIEAAKFDAALQSHHDALIADWKRDDEAGDAEGDRGSDPVRPFPNRVDAFLGLVDAGWDTEAARRPHGHHTTVVVHVDLDTHGHTPVAALHLGPVLTDADRRYLLCDTSCEV